MHLTRTYSSATASLADMRAFVRQACEGCWSSGAKRGALDALTLAVHESATNIIRHAYGGDPDRSIDVAVDVDEEIARIELRDTGKRFKLEAVEAPVFDGTRVGGFGVYLIGKLVDDVQYDRDAHGRNITRLLKRRW